MTSWVDFSGLAVADGKVYAVDHDSNVYCFGLPPGVQRNQIVYNVKESHLTLYTN